MSTLGIGPVEILVILAVTLIVFGPQRIPELARYVAKAMKMLRDASNELQKQLEAQNWDFDLEDKKKKKKTTSTSSYDGYGYNSSTTSSSTGSVPSSSTGTDSTAPAAAVTDSNPAGGYASSESLSTSPAESGEAPPAAAPTPAAIEDPAKTGDAHRFARELAD